jgi:hypothetical protein
MDIEEFYDGDPRRRPSAEIELGRAWQDKDGLQYELNFIEDTGELYAMSQPPSHERTDPFGGIHEAPQPGYEKTILVRVVANIDSVDNLHEILSGWQTAMTGEGGVEWLADRLRAAGVAVAPESTD